MASTSSTGVETESSLQELFPMEGDDAGCANHPTSNRGNTAQQQASLDDSKRMALTGPNS